MIEALTFGLILVTAWYGWATWKMLDEAKQAREAGFKPYIHPHFQRSNAGNPDGCFVLLDLVNLWKGPGLSVRGYLHHSGIQFTASPLVQEIGQLSREIRFTVKEVRDIKVVDSVANLWLEYRDLLEHKWATAARILISVGKPRDNDTLTITLANIVVLKDSVRFLPIDRFYIDQLTGRADHTSIPWPEDWTKRLTKN